ncbi:MgtC/SapB family protein [Fluviibacter phosphoraccumulans]|mgnify:FL=1|uniref:MgtC/SapB family protein n=1 Tax=Fluviibacter phosphoraccumulans TaxID=1751046 RepID=UPI0010B6E7EB|nr:MgtC/SapB family protein [Fluviibacter phosphoraccumulans]BCA65675.1 methyltransferase [Fluviibacter phosphoraccumulans]
MISAINHLRLDTLIDTSVSLVAAFVLGGLIGYERQFRQRTAGLRTNVLVSVGAALFVDMAATLAGHEGAVHVVAYVVSGIGFLGAGVIMREEGNVRGLNTAATLWGSAAIGACAGADLLIEATLGTLFVLAANTLLRPVANQINRQPTDTMDVEATNAVYVITAKQHQKLTMQKLVHLLQTSSYPTREIDVHAFGESDVEIEAVLNSTSVDAVRLDTLVSELSQLDYVHQAFWSASTSD